MSHTVLNRTGGTAHWTKGCLPCAERSCEGSDGPQKTFSTTVLESNSICHARVCCGLRTTVSGSTHIFLHYPPPPPPRSCSQQITTKLQKHGQYEPPPHFPSNLLPSHAGTASSSPPLPSMAWAPRLPACWLFCFLRACQLLAEASQVR